MTNIIQRELSNSKINILINNKETLIPSKSFFKNFPTNKCIRIQKDEFDSIPNIGEEFTHFNLQISNHKEGEIYILPKILKSGFLKKGKEKLPLLEFDNCYIGKCIEVKENIPYNKLKKEDFKTSFKHIQNISQLKKEIIKRYSKSLPELSSEEILKLGVSKTKLIIIDKMRKTTQNKVKKILKTKEISKSYITHIFPELEDKKILNKIKNSNNFISEFKTNKGTTRKGFGQSLFEQAKKNKNIIALSADLTDSLQLTKIKEDLPNQFYQFGICEQNMMSAAAGMAIIGKIPFVCSYAAFNPGRNWDQLRVSVCYSNHNVKILGGHAGLTTGPDGATHQALEDIAITRVLPNLIVVVPSDENQTQKATKEILKHQGPAYLRVSRENCLNLTDKKTPFEIGKANVYDNGEDITIIACGLTLQLALVSREILKQEGISASVIDMHTIKPLDTKTLLKFAKKTKAILTVEEHQSIGGLGSAVSEYLSQNIPIPLEIVGVKDTFGESGGGYELLSKYGISIKEILIAAKRVLKRKENL